MLYGLRVQDVDVWKMDKGTFKQYIPENFEKDSESDTVVQEAEKAIAAAATTKLEWKMFAALGEKSGKQCSDALKAAEGNYSVKYRLSRTEHVHPALTLKRDEFIAASH